MRTWWEYHEDTIKFLDEYPNIMQAEVLCIYPASTDRLTAKGVDKVIYIMSKIKEYGFSVAFICANQWATGTQRKEDIFEYYRLARRSGLDVKEGEFIFTSSFAEGKYDTGLPKRILRELLILGNLFIFPTREESFGLVAPEAAMCGNMMVLNKSLQSQLEVNGFTGTFFDFGSFTTAHEVDDFNLYYKDVAQIIVGIMQRDSVVISKTYHRTRYNYDYIYNKYYSPLFGEMVLWR